LKQISLKLSLQCIAIIKYYNVLCNVVSNKANDMTTTKMEATISISKVYTVIDESSVFNIKSSEFSDVIKGYSEITIKGYFSKSKYNKIIAEVLCAGFSIKNISYLDFKDDSSVDFRITYTLTTTAPKGV
jgi:hypothetical protein